MFDEGSKIFYRWSENTLILEVKIQAGAPRDSIVGCYGGRLKIAVAAPPIDNRANERLVKFLSKIFLVPQHKIKIINGGRGKNKRISIRDPEVKPENIDSIR